MAFFKSKFMPYGRFCLLPSTYMSFALGEVERSSRPAVIANSLLLICKRRTQDSSISTGQREKPSSFVGFFFPFRMAWSRARCTSRFDAYLHCSAWEAPSAKTEHQAGMASRVSEIECLLWIRCFRQGALDKGNIGHAVVETHQCFPTRYAYSETSCMFFFETWHTCVGSLESNERWKFCPV